MARGRVSVRIAANFERNLESIEAFLAEAGAPQAYDALLIALAHTVIPNLERYPRMGRLFLERMPQSMEAQQRMQALKKRTDAGELREYLSGDYLMLYALIGTRVNLLAIKHHRQLSFDLGAHWLA